MTSCKLLVLSVLVAATAWPQAGVSNVRGTAKDTAQAVIPGAKVVLLNPATGVTRETVTNGAGLFVIPGVNPGAYRLTVSSPGLQNFEGNLTVRVQQDAEVEAVLNVATAVTTVSVQEVTQLVKTDAPTLGQVLERQRIEELPINGRSYQGLLATVPGIDATGRIQAYGLRVGTHTLLFDGASMNEIWEGWDFGRPPGLDAIEEFKVETNNSSARFTRPTTVVLSSRSGTNSFHGALFETNRNSGYGVARQRQDNYTKPPFINRNEYGVSAGGPVYLPKIYNGKNRTFFFFGYESQRAITYTTSRFNVPSAAMKAGDFSGLLDSQGRLIRIYDPATTDLTTWKRDQFGYNGVANVINPSRLSPIAKYLFGVTPLPTNPAINPLIDSNWIGAQRRVEKNDSWSTRIDHRFSEKDLLYGRFSRGTKYQEYAYPQQIMLDYLSSVTNRWWPNNTVAGTWVRTFSPTLTSEANVTFSRDYQRRGTGDYTTHYSDQLLGLPNPLGAPNFPEITNVGLSNYQFGGDSIFYLISNYLTLQDNFTKIAGKHELQFGFQFRLEDIPKSSVPLSGGFTPDTNATGLYDTTSSVTTPLVASLTGSNLANLFLGSMNYGAQFRRPWIYMRRQEYAPYIQDNWKVSSRLTLNLGMRYEFRTPIYDRNDSLMSFDYDKHAYVIGTTLDKFIQLGATLPQIVNTFKNFGGKIITAQEAGLPTNLVYNNWKNFGPRIGFAYRAFDGKKAFVVRGGYRISYYTQPITTWFSGQTQPQLVSSSFQNTVSNQALSPDGVQNYGLRTTQKYVAGLNTPSSIIDINDTRSLTRGFTAIQTDPHLPDPRVYDWNLTLEKEVASNMVVRFGYVGNHSANNMQTISYNDSTPDYIWYTTKKISKPGGEFSGVATRPYDQTVYGTVNTLSMRSFTNNSTFQAEIERRYHNGFGFQLFWVGGNTLATSGTISSTNNFLPGAVPEDIDARNRLLNYARDPITPKHQIKWNWVADIPIGKGKRFFSNTNRVVDKFVGGWQIAGLGNWRTNYFALPTNSDANKLLYPTGNPIQLYGHQYPIQDCRGGVCSPGYLYWNGYIPSNLINSVDANGKPNGVMGVPANYKPAAQPLIPWGSTTLPANAPANTTLSTYWDTNTVWIPLTGVSAPQRTTFNDGLYPWKGQSLPGIHQWFLDASLFKFVPLTERVTMRFNVDFFNVLNNPNDPTSVGSDGINLVRDSGSAARVMQLTLRLTW